MAKEEDDSGSAGWRPYLLTIVTALALAGALLFEPIPQDPAYHDFADRRFFLGIPNALDLLSNLPFLLVGFAGFRDLWRGRLRVDAELRPAYGVFFAGVALIAVGSGYYHFSPSNPALAWDRLPMTLAFSSLVTVVLGEFVSLRLGQRLLWPLVTTGVSSVGWWVWTEATGQGDLRPYALVQFLPILLLPLVFMLYRSRWTKAGQFWLMGGWYVLSKGLEFADRAFLTHTGLLSGHTLKHVAAAAAAGCLLRMLRRRTFAGSAKGQGES